MMYDNNKRLALNIFWIVLGAALIALSAADILDPSVCSGMGGALIAVGALRLVKAVRYRRDAAYREKVDTEVKDERNRFLHMKSWAWTGYTVVLVEGLGVVIAAILGQREIRLLLSCSVCLIITVYWIAYLILSKKY